MPTTQQRPAPAVNRRRDPRDLKPDPSEAAKACRALIEGDTQAAMRLAVRAFGLPPDFVETEGGRWH